MRPDRTERGDDIIKEKVTAYDSGMASLAAGFLALEGARMAKAGGVLLLANGAGSSI